MGQPLVLYLREIFSPMRNPIKRPLKRFLPKTLFGRSLMILVTPLIILQLVSAWIFLDRHWERISWRLSITLAGEIAFLLDQMAHMPDQEDRLIARAKSLAQFRSVQIFPGAVLPEPRIRDTLFLAPLRPESMVFDVLQRALAQRLNYPFSIEAGTYRENVHIYVQRGPDVIDIRVPGNRLFSSTIYIFILWMIGLSLILLIIAILFLRNQIRPLARLAQSVENFGKGRDDKGYHKLEGATEIRQAALAYNRMSERIRRQIKQRTDMLAAVSHDLRTPLTRMRLELEFLEDPKTKSAMVENLHEMDGMIDAYLAFARGEEEELAQPIDLTRFTERIVKRWQHEKLTLDSHCEGSLSLVARPISLGRAVDNIIANAKNHAQHIRFYVSRRISAGAEFIEFLIDDDGPGIPADLREQAFQPFVRLDQSRNPATGGTGLGLSITQDIVTRHGGQITLEDSPIGGLRVRMRLPL